MRTKLGVALLLAGALALVGFAGVALAGDNEGVCRGLDSGKINVSGEIKSLTITAPAGFLIDGYCVKAGSVNQGNGPEYYRVNPPQPSFTISHSSGKDISHYSVSYIPIETPETPTPTPTDPTPTPTDPTPTPTEPTPTPTEPTPTPTEPTPTSTPCVGEELGMQFTLIGPEGQSCKLASYQKNPNTGDWAIPNVGAQSDCCGFVAVQAIHGEEIVRSCDGEINIVCYRCKGGADDIPGAYYDN